MLKFLFIFFLISVQISSYSQSLNDKLTNIPGNGGNQNIPADQVFLHIDRNLFHPGDTIRFQAYISDRQTGIFETKSLSLYALLVNSVHKTIDSARFRINNSTASGWLKIPENTPYNDYSVLAFTSRMMNYDPESVFTVPVRIDKLRPGLTRGDQKSVNERDKTFKMEVSYKSIDLRFFPEGGTFINGISQNLAFVAKNSFGTTFNAEGSIINQKGEKICDFKSGSLGPGIVAFAPLSGNNYYATLNGKEFEGMKWPLPVAEDDGVSLGANSLYNGIVTIGVEGKNISGSSYIISMMMNNIVVLAKEFKLDSVFSLKVSTAQLPAGTAYITLFNSDLRPVAERLIFVNSQKKLNIGISTSSSFYKPGDVTELTINTTDKDGNNTGAVVSVSVIDSVSGFYERFPFADIETTFLFEREFYDKLPADLKLKGLSDVNDDDLDLLLMTYGWRKFRTKEPSDTVIVRELKNYDYLKIKNSGPDKKVRKEISLISLEGSESYSVMVDKNKEACLAFDSLNASVRQLMIMPDKNPSRNIYPVIAELPENKLYTDKAKLHLTGDLPQNMNVEYKRTPTTDYGLDSAIMIETVTIKGSRVPAEKFVNKYEIQYRNANTVTLTSKDFTTCLNFEDILVRMHPYQLDTRNKKVIINAGRTARFSARPPPALILLDDIPQIGSYDSPTGNGYMNIADMPASNISSVTMLRGLQGYTIYGQDAIGGVIFVTTNVKATMDGTYERVKFNKPEVRNDVAKPIRIFRSEIEYYIPQKEEVQSDPEFRFRPTLLWRSDVLSDGSGPVKLSFPNNLFRGTVMVIVNGVSFTNMVGAKSYKYMVK